MKIVLILFGLILLKFGAIFALNENENDAYLSVIQTSINEHFHFDDQIHFHSIVRKKTSNDSNRVHRILRFDVQLISVNDRTIYECSISIYENFQAKLRTNLRPTICFVKESFNSEPMISLDQVDEENDFYEEDLFEKFQTIFRKFYSTKTEQVKRFENFRKNLNFIDELNANEKGTAVYGITQFSDLNSDEFRRFYLNEYLKNKLPTDLSRTEKLVESSLVTPDEFDWRSFNAVTPVKNQGQCGSCWAFSVTGNIEGIWKIRRGQLISLSEQELIDCDHVDEGCNGGYMTNAYDQIIQFNGLMTEDDYKYRAKQQNQCQLDPTKVRVKINSYLNISSDENEMAEWLSSNGPISIGLNANMMQFYFRGVAHPHRSFCNPQDLNHGVLLVGYGTEKKRSKSIPFWIIKNSWGEHWGEKGYYRLYRGDGSCGVNLMCSSAIVD